MIARTVLAAIAFALILLFEALSLRAQADDKPIGILLAAGDISTCGNKEWHRYADRTAAIIHQVIKTSNDADPKIPVRVLALGDLAYGKGTAEQFKCFGGRWKGFNDVLLPVPGNHEYLSDNAEPYFKHFEHNPFVNQNGKGKGYFTLNFPRPEGPWRLIGLNAHLRGAKAMQDQLSWLSNQLDPADESNRQNCVLAFWHTPTFSSGRHGHDYNVASDAPLSKVRPMQSALRILYNYGASVVLAGHDHNYEQFRKHDPEGNAADDGVRSFVVGTGGSLLTEDNYVNRFQHSEILYGRTKGGQGLLKISLYEDSYRWEFLSMDDSKKLSLPSQRDTCTRRKGSPA